MEQLDVYSHMLEGKDRDEYDRIYQRWLNERFTGEWWTWDRSVCSLLFLIPSPDMRRLLTLESKQKIQREQTLNRLIDP